MSSPVPFLTGLTISVSGRLSDGKSHLQDASEIEGLQIVSQDWFFQSVHQEMLLDTKKFLLRNHLQKKGKGKSKSSAKTSKKQDLDHAEFDEDTPDETHEDSEGIIHATTHAKILGREAELHSLVDEDCPWKTRDHVVYLDDQNRNWDAILIKDNSTRDKSGITTNKVLDLEVLQLLYDLKTKSLRFWRSAQSTKPPGLVDLVHSTVSNTAKSDFQDYFLQQTGLAWKDRWAVPKEGKHIFVPRIFEDVESEEPTALHDHGQKDTKLPSEVCKTLAVIFDHRNKHSILSSIAKISANGLSGQKWRRRLTLRAAKSLLERVSEIVFDRFQRHSASRAKLLSHLGRCYLALMWASNLGAPPKLDLPVSFEVKNWLKRERAGLELLYNLSFALDLMESSTNISNDQMINRLHRGLGLANMELVKSGTPEHNALKEYFLEPHSHIPGNTIELVNIFRIEREGESQRFDQYQKSHAALVGDRRLLFHGSIPANWIGILSQGLRSDAQTRVTPGIPVGGIYFADRSAKSIPYCLRGLNDRPNNHCMVLCEVEVGKKQETFGNFFDVKTLHKRGHVASFLGGNTIYNKWSDAGKVHPDLAGIDMPDTLAEGKQPFGVTTPVYSEWVVYDPAQIRQRYFFHFTI